MNKEKYIVITPVRDEEEYIKQTIRSMLAQTIRPIRWVIVNDGSSDSTGRIIKEYANEFSWIEAVERKDRGFRKSGGGVVEAFYEGYRAIQTEDWDFLVKLDGDLTFESDYFEKCFEYFRKNSKLGLGGGTVYHTIKGIPKTEEAPRFHVRGATKIYRKDCWDAIEGLVQTVGWDTIDEVKANMMGWETQSFPDIRISHHRFTGAADGTWASHIKYGKANYISGYHPLFMFVKCIKRIFQKPYLIGSLGLICGFIGCYLTKLPQVSDKAMIRYIRRQQLNRLFLRKSIWG